MMQNLIGKKSRASQASLRQEAVRLAPAEGVQLARSTWYDPWKAAFEFVAALLMLIVAAPLIALSALLVFGNGRDRLTSSGTGGLHGPADPSNVDRATYEAANMRRPGADQPAHANTLRCSVPGLSISTAPACEGAVNARHHRRLLAGGA